MFGGNVRRGMNGKPLFPTGAGEDITVPIVRIAPKGWAASRKHGLTCLGNGIMGRTPKHRKIVLRGPTKKYGGNAAKGIATSRQSAKKHLEISDVPFVLGISQFLALMILQLAFQHWLKNGILQKMGT